jgi:Zn-dependent protease/CBS domain-containing protein
MFANSWRVGSVKGIQLGVHPSWLIVLVFFTWSLARGWYPTAYPTWSPATYWIAGAVSTLLLFASVLLHELGHALTALRLGVPVRSIVLFIFGGVATLERDADSPGKEFWIAVMGPVVSVALALAFYLLSAITGPLGQPVVAVATYLAIINALLVVFNLIPGFPLDGGRILRAAVWGFTNDYKRATRITSVVGQACAYALIFFGITRILGGNVFGGLWTVFVGWFLLSAASASYQQVETRDALAGVTVRNLFRTDPPVVPRGISVAELVQSHIVPKAERAHLVMDNERFMGMITLTDVTRHSQTDWDTTTVGEAMTPVADLKTVTPDTRLSAAMQLMASGDYNQLPVVESGAVLGLLNRADLMRYLTLRAELGVEDTAGSDSGHEDRRVGA